MIRRQVCAQLLFACHLYLSSKIWTACIKLHGAIIILHVSYDNRFRCERNEKNIHIMTEQLISKLLLAAIYFS